MTSQTDTTTTGYRSVRGSATALDALASVLGDTFATVRVERVLVTEDRVHITAPMTQARPLARALFGARDGYVHPGNLVTEWQGQVDTRDGVLFVHIHGKRDDEAAIRRWAEGVKVARAVLAAQAVPAQFVADVLRGGVDSIAPAPAVTLRAVELAEKAESGTYRHVRERCTRLVEARTVNAAAVARADVRSYLRGMDELGFYGPDDCEAADAAFLVVFGVSR